MEREGDNPEVGAVGMDDNNNITPEKYVEKESNGQFETENPEETPNENELAKKTTKNRNRRKKKELNVKDALPETETQESLSVESIEVAASIVAKPEIESVVDESMLAMGLTIEDFPKKKRKRNHAKKEGLLELSGLAQNNDDQISMSSEEISIEQLIQDAENYQAQAAQKQTNPEFSIINLEEEEEIIQGLAIEENQEVTAPFPISSAATPAPSFSESPGQLDVSPDVQPVKELNEESSPRGIKSDQENEFAQQLEEKLNKLAVTSLVDPFDNISSDKSMAIPETPHTSLQLISNVDEDLLIEQVLTVIGTNELDVNENKDKSINFVPSPTNAPNAFVSEERNHEIESEPGKSLAVLEEAALGYLKEKSPDDELEKNMSEECEGVKEALGYLADEPVDPSAKEIATLHFHGRGSSKEPVFAIESDYGLVKEQAEYMDLIDSDSACQHFHTLPHKGTWEDRSAPLEFKTVAQITREDQEKAEAIKKQIIANTRAVTAINLVPRKEQFSTSISRSSFSTSCKRTSRSAVKDTSTSGHTRRRSLSRRLSDGIRNMIPCYPRPRKNTPSPDTGFVEPKSDGALPKIMKP